MSSVVAAVLLFALFTTVFVLFCVQTLPEWEADREHLHQREMQQGMASLVAGLGGLSARHDPGPVLGTFRLGTPPVPLLQPSAAAGDLELVDPLNEASRGISTAINFPSGAALILADGNPLLSPTVAIGSNPSPCPGPCIKSLEAFVVGFTTSGVSAGTATLTVTAADGYNPAATALLQHAAGGAGTACGAGSQVTVVVGSISTPVLCGAGASLSGYRIDLMDAKYGFAAAVGRLQAPYSLTLSGSTSPSAAASTYAAAWQTTAGIEQVLGTGAASPKPIPDQSGGRLVFTPHHQRFPNQALSLEGGAVIAVESAARQAVAVEPSFQLAVQGGMGYLQWTLVTLRGAGGQMSGVQDVTASVTHTASQDLLVTTPPTCSPCATLGVGSPQGAAWGAFFSSRARAAATGTSTTVAGPFLNLASGPGQPVTLGWVLHVRIIQADAVLA